MKSIVKRSVSWLVPVVIALAIAPAAAMADSQESETIPKNQEQSQSPLLVQAESSVESDEVAPPKEMTGGEGSSGSNLMSGIESSNSEKAVRNGLVLIDGHLVNYAEDVEEPISGWREYEGSWYWFADSSRASESEWVKTGGSQYRLSSDGKMLVGTFSVEGSLYYATSSGSVVTGDGWTMADGKWWYPDASGALCTGWLFSGGNWYWLDGETGAMATGWVKAADGAWYLMNASGAMLTGWQKAGAWYYLESSGAMRTGWLNDKGSWYWLSRDSGAMKVGWIEDDNGKWWFAEESGALASSARWVKGAHGSWYRVDNNGAMAIGWRYVSEHWYWMESSQEGKMAADAFIDDGGTYYWCDSSGAMLTNGWCKDDAWHWASGSGAMASGWVQVGGSWYWLDPMSPKHPMLTGFQSIDGSDYFLEESGSMASKRWVEADSAGNLRFASPSGALGGILRDANGVLTNNGALCSGWVDLGGGVKAYADPVSHKAKTGWIKEGATYYYAEPSSGAVVTDWQKVDGVWYLFNSNGEMLTGWQKVGGSWYFMEQSGAMQTGWLNKGGVWYWLDGSGAMATGWRMINGTWYYFNGSGEWVPNPERAQMTDRIWGNSSGTQWLIAVNRSTHKVGIYRGAAYAWSLYYYVDCVTGAPSSPTITGTFRTSGGKKMALDTDSRARWCTQISGGYFFHTILASNNELGKSLSHGCVRMAYPDARWIYENIYAGTTVVIYG